MMDSWSYVSEGKGFASEEANSSFDPFAKSKNALNPSSYYENNIHFISESNNDQVIGELGFPKLIQNSFDNVLSNKDGGDESSSKLSSSIVESSTRDSISSLIDLKLGRFVVDHRNVKQNFKSSSESSSTPPVKRFRSANLNAKNSFFCQVHGCNKDLSGCKDYHKRHKVCEAHSKTARVTVNGIEQRFCQQCSRFHLLDEFDDGKRSCRKRLAGHNERRRKPQIGIHSGRNGRLFQSYNGFAENMLNRSSILTSGSFTGQYIAPNGQLDTEDYEPNDWCKRIKQEDIMDFGPPLAIPLANRNLQSKPEYSHFHENGSMISSGSRYPHDPSELNYGSRSLGSDDLADFDTALSATGRALSLLSSQQLHNSSSQSHSTRTLRDQLHGRYNGMSQVSEEGLVRVSSQSSINRVTNQFHSSRMNEILVSDGCNNAANVDITNETLQRSEYVNHKGSLFCEDGPSTTIDLLQLSSQLQRVECQRQSTQGIGFLHMED